ncbi:MAG: flavin reductase family protein [Chloroflexi bacterium]|nr:flavin reductase family protein [Chloroflexota bacterium]
MINVNHYQKQDVPLETVGDGYPVFIPSIAVLVSCADETGRANITPIVAWTVVSRYPFTVAIGLCNGDYSENYFPRYSREIIQRTGEFVLNIPHSGLREAVSITGDVSGRDLTVDKFALAGLTPGPARVVKAPIIMECPVNLECQVTQVVDAGSHDVFFGKVVAIQSDPILKQVIEDDVMVVDLLRPLPDDEGTRPTRLYWRTLPDFTG